MNENKDFILKDRIVFLTSFADAIIYLIDTENIAEDNKFITQKALEEKLFDYIYEKYKDKPIFVNNIRPDLGRYLNKLYKIGFSVAESRQKYKHAENNGLLNLIGVSFDIIVNWNNYTDEVLKELKGE